MSANSCPKCFRPVVLPSLDTMAADSAWVRCPLCRAEYRLQEALDFAPPVLELIPEPVGQPAAASEWGAPPAFGAAALSAADLDEQDFLAADDDHALRNGTAAHPLTEIGEDDDTLPAMDAGAVMQHNRMAGLDAAPRGFGAEERREFFGDAGDTYNLAGGEGAATAEDDWQPMPAEAGEASGAAFDPDAPPTGNVRRRKPKKPKNPVVEMAKVLVGGVLGLGIGYAILIWGFQKDPFKLAKFLPPAIVPESLQKPTSVSGTGGTQVAQNTDNANNNTTNGIGGLPADNINVPSDFGPPPTDTTGGNSSVPSDPNSTPSDPSSTTPSDPTANNPPLPNPLDPNSNPAIPDPLSIPNPLDPSIDPALMPKPMPKPVDPLATDPAIPSDPTLPTDPAVPQPKPVDPLDPPVNDPLANDPLNPKPIGPKPVDPAAFEPENPLPADPKPADPKPVDPATPGDFPPVPDPVQPPPAAPPVGPKVPAPLTLEDVAKSMTAASEAVAALAAAPADLPVPDRNKLRAGYYKGLSSLADTVTHVRSVDEDDATARSAATELVLQAAADRERLEELGRLAGAWMASKNRTGNGVVLTGLVQEVAPVGKHFRTTVKLFGRDDPPVVVISAAKPTLLKDETALVLGSIVKQPAENVHDYEGTEEVIVWGAVVTKPGADNSIVPEEKKPADALPGVQ